MSIETRLRNGADEARRVAAEFDRRSIEARSASFARRAAFVAAAGVVVVAIAVAGIWASAAILTNDEEVADPPSPDLEWQQVEAPPEVDVIQDIWVDSEGFNIWSGNELWTSQDGHQWSLEIDTPSQLGGYATRGSLVRIDTGWIGVGDQDSVPTVYRSVDDEWISNPLPVGEARTAVWRLASNESGVVAAGARTTGGGDSELLVWHSADGATWQTVELGEGYPLSLDTRGSGFVLVEASFSGEATTVWESDNGLEWTVAAESAELVTSDPALFRGTLVAISLQTEVVAIRPGGESESIWTGPDSTGPDLNLSLGEVDAGAFGLLASAFDSSTEDVPVVAMWYSPDAERWTRYDLLDLFGEQGTVFAAVGGDRVVVAFEPGGSAGMSPEAPYQLWVGTAHP